MSVDPEEWPLNSADQPHLRYHRSEHAQLSMIDMRDVSTVISRLIHSRYPATCLTQQTLTLIGPIYLTASVIVHQLSEVCNRHIDFQYANEETVEKYLTTTGDLTTSEIAILLALFQLARHHKPIILTNDYNTIIGRDPITLSFYLQQHATLFNPQMRQHIKILDVPRRAEIVNKVEE